MASAGRRELPTALLLVSLMFPVALTRAAIFDIVNRCPYTVWAAAIPGWGRQLNPGETWTLNVNTGTAGGRVWARTGCSFDASSLGQCQTSDCGGVLQCGAYG